MLHGRQALVIDTPEQLLSAKSRRDFLRAVSLGGPAIFLPGVFAACSDDSDPAAPGVTTATLDLSTDTGILNYAYALEQLESAFYVRAIQEAPVAGFNAIHRRLLQDIRNHEFIHREALRALLGASRLPDLRLDRGFAGTDFRSRLSILETARTMEDLGVSAYNNSGRYMTDAANLLLVAKIGSVEGRHSAIVRDLIDELGGGDGRLFAGDDIVDEDGLDNKGQPTAPAAVLSAADPFIAATITITNAPA